MEEREQRVYDFLLEYDIPYERFDHHDEPGENMEICRRIEKRIGASIPKNLFLCNRQQTKFYLLIMPGEKPFKTKELSSQINSARLSFATPEHMISILDTAPGAASLMSLINDKEGKVQLLVDEDLLSNEYLCCHPCVNTSTLKLTEADALGTFLKAVNHDMMIVTLLGTD
ncbi:MAG: prolyl-tRNA synthetase associated domain-containing protein [Lachnospiraceae bacterium]|nr:prolyl-tRNA synthetase associated domain-containing protein [Lachnospiraceae bacterium]